MAFPVEEGVEEPKLPAWVFPIVRGVEEPKGVTPASRGVVERHGLGVVEWWGGKCTPASRGVTCGV